MSDEKLSPKKYPVLSKILGSGKACQTREPIYTRVGLLRSFTKRFQILSHLNKGTRLESLYPNDNFSEKDVAFGYLKNHEIVVASDFKMDIEVGYIAHVLMLIALGYAKDETDQHPTVDYLIRGIVKAAMNNDVIFWETPPELLEADNFDALQECLRELKKKNLISDANNVYGANNGANLALGTVGKILQAT
jgi:hypothetical protein